MTAFRTLPIPLLVLALALPLASQTVDVVGSAGNMSTQTGRAKGNSYMVATDVVLVQTEFWLTFTNTQNLTFYVYQSPVEFGTYTQVYAITQPVAGIGSAWYSSPTLGIPLSMGMYYIIAVSWDGSLTYYFGTGDSQGVSFGSHVHGYAVGAHPLPASLTSSVNDQAIYHQRITTSQPTPPAPMVTPVGTGCTGTGGLVPVLSTSQLPFLGNSSFIVDVGQGAPSSQAFLFLSAGLAPVPSPIGGGCLVYLDVPSMLQFVATGSFPLGPLPTSPSGATSFPLPVPAISGLAGLHIGVQAAIADAVAPAGFTLTNALDLLLN